MKRKPQRCIYVLPVTDNKSTTVKQSLPQPRSDLELELYGQLREVERCLERFPESAPEAVKKLIGLVRRYNPELVWSERVDPFGLGIVDRMERTGEPWL